MRPFFSRRIGLDDDGNTIPITYGARLSGNLNKDLRIGAMNMHTNEVDLKPGQNYTSLALHQRVWSRSILKGYFHNRTAYRQGAFQKDNYNRVGGLEFAYRSEDGRWQGLAGYGKSFSEAKNTENYFYNAAIGFDNRNWSFYSNVAGIGDHYQADMGFMPRMDHYDAVRDTTITRGFHHQYTRLSYTLRPQQNPQIISHQWGLRSIFDLTTDLDLIQNQLSISYDLQFSNTSTMSLEWEYLDANLLYPFTFTENPLPAGRYDYHNIMASFSTDQRNVFNLEAGLSFGSFYNGRRNQYLLELKYRAQPWGNFSLNFVQNNLKFPADYGDEDLFLVGSKIEFNFSRNLFWTTFLQYNTQRDNFNINSRFQWRFKPLSDIYLVYTDNYAVEFWGPKNRALVLKMNYWLNL